MIAALFVAKNGCYFGLPGVDPWDETRNAMLYAGPWPVVAHPPCSRWCRLAGLVEARWGYKRGEDGGAFDSALSSVRNFGGVLEHPAYSDAFAAHGIARPVAGSGWQRTFDGGWVCHVEQWHYGHRAKKATWLYAFGCTPPALIGSTTPDNAVTAYVTDGGGDVKRRRAKRAPAPISWCGNHTNAFDKRPRLGHREALATPTAFRDVLIGIARSVQL